MKNKVTYVFFALTLIFSLSAWQAKAEEQRRPAAARPGTVEPHGRIGASEDGDCSSPEYIIVTDAAAANKIMSALPKEGASVPDQFFEERFQKVSAGVNQIGTCCTVTGQRCTRDGSGGWTCTPITECHDCNGL